VTEEFGYAAAAELTTTILAINLRDTAPDPLTTRRRRAPSGPAPLLPESGHGATTAGPTVRDVCEAPLGMDQPTADGAVGYLRLFLCLN
jgi:hypothetical protein